jgi:ribosomal protein S18 acetylase RimI-like enzyme
MVSNDRNLKIEIKKLENLDQAQQCAQMMANSEPWITLGRTYQVCLKLLQDPSREVYVALREGYVVGFIILLMQGILRGYVQTVGVMPEWRNRGVGSLLMAFAEKRIFRESPNVFLCVSSFNKAAQKFYRRLGYEMVGRLEDFIVPGHSEVLLRKTIAPLSEFKKSHKR